MVCLVLEKKRKEKRKEEEWACLLTLLLLTLIAPTARSHTTRRACYIHYLMLFVCCLYNKHAAVTVKGISPNYLFDQTSEVNPLY